MEYKTKIARIKNNRNGARLLKRGQFLKERPCFIVLKGDPVLLKREPSFFFMKRTFIIVKGA